MFDISCKRQTASITVHRRRTQGALDSFIEEHMDTLKQLVSDCRLWYGMVAYVLYTKSIHETIW
jgi:hypothetical protein